MKYDFTIFGSGISAKISAIALAKNDFNICMISDRDFKIPKSSNNLVTFLSSGSLYFLTSIINIFCHLIALPVEAAKYLKVPIWIRILPQKRFSLK